jgi:hypothetical protein
MVSPMTLFTPEDLLLYLYKESSPELTAAIETALKEDWTLREKIQELQSTAEHLDKVIVAPRMEIVLKVLKYARITSPESAQHS